MLVEYSGCPEPIATYFSIVLGKLSRPLWPPASDIRGATRSFCSYKLSRSPELQPPRPVTAIGVPEGNTLLTTAQVLMSAEKRLHTNSRLVWRTPHLGEDCRLPFSSVWCFFSDNAGVFRLCDGHLARATEEP